MSMWRKFVVVGLLVGMVHLSVADLVSARSPDSSGDPAEVKQKVEMLGVKSKVEVIVKGGERVLGTIQSVGEDGFELTTSDRQSRHIAYAQVQSINLTKPVYKAYGQPDPVGARRVVASWGTGKTIRVTMADGSKLRGKLQAIGTEDFTLVSKSQSEPVKIAFADVQQVEGGGTTTATWLIILGSIVGGAIVLGAILVSASSG